MTSKHANPLRVPLNKKQGKRFTWANLQGGAISLAMQSAITQHTDGPVAIITPDTLTANQLRHEIAFFQAETQETSLAYPDWETLPYDRFSPHQDIISTRLKTLNQLPHRKRGSLIVSANTLMQRIAPQNFVQNFSFFLNIGDQLNIDELRRRLTRIAYRCVNQVFEHGEFSVRGSIIDLFPMGSDLPFRIELFDNEVDSIRTFDTNTQRSLDVIHEICLFPAKEFPTDEKGISRFRESWREIFDGNPLNCPTYKHVSEEIFPPGIEYYLPLFFKQTDTLLDYLPDNTLLITFDIKQAIKTFSDEIQDRYEQRRHDVTQPLLPPEALFLNEQQLLEKLNRFTRIQLTKEPIEHNPLGGKYCFATKALPDITQQHKTKDNLQPLKAFLENHPHRIVFCAETPGRRETLLALLGTHNLHPTLLDTWQDCLNNTSPTCLMVSEITQGFILEPEKLTLITEADLFGDLVIQKRRRKQSDASLDTDTAINNLGQLEIDSPVVHFEHGVGRYKGLTSLDINQQQTEFLCLEYAGKDKLYVPITSLHLISPYSGTSLEHAPVNKLGTGQWDKAKEKAAKRVRDVAAELLDIYARRQAKQGFAYQSPDAEYTQFAAEFPFEETPDQEKAIAQVLQDMTKTQPMDRLICGDVGFGKTEVAMRALFLAVSNNKQTCLLAPTTLLVEQHHQTLTDRFANYPVNIEVLSRFKSAKEQEATIKKLAAGTVDIVIGTHKLLQERIKFKNLGLIVIDEEHRFGVKQKETLKALRTNVDILTLTATPIPRTLNLALSNIRDLSIIATPPAKRLSIKTFVEREENNLIRESILREILRGGQVYFLHNEVASINQIEEKLQTLVPEAKIAIGHGQMRERDLEHTMSNFYHHRFNVLLCTTIIETGIDVPNANTIIIRRADKFGLAQLHQLRGRVGRSHHQAYAYLLTPTEKPLSKDAEKRLSALQASEDLGAGFTLAMHDLEIRGAGEFLGAEQSGQIQEIGFSLYNEMLEHAVNAIKQGKEIDLAKPLTLQTDINLGINALIPATFMGDVNTRLQYYKRIASAKNTDTLDDIQAEIIDRFGFLPTELKALFDVTELKLFAQTLGIQKIECSAKSGRIDFTETPNIDSGKMINLIQTQPKDYQLTGPTRLRFSLKDDAPEGRIKKINQLLVKLTN